MTSPQQPQNAGPLYLTDSEEEYAEGFRAAGWSEHAIEIELERFRAFKAGVDPDRVMTLREAMQTRRDYQNSFTNPQPEPESEPDQDELLAALQRVRDRKKSVD